jgi:hypothetical protein
MITPECTSVATRSSCVWIGPGRGALATSGPLLNEAAVDVVPVVRHLRTVTSL